jgi:hypothetical protein
MPVFANRKGGSSVARSQRARAAHARRRGRLFAVAPGSGRAHYKGTRTRRVKPTWII